MLDRHSCPKEFLWPPILALPDKHDQCGCWLTLWRDPTMTCELVRAMAWHCLFVGCVYSTYIYIIFLWVYVYIIRDCLYICIYTYICSYIFSYNKSIHMKDSSTNMYCTRNSRVFLRNLAHDPEQNYYLEIFPEPPDRLTEVTRVPKCEVIGQKMPRNALQKWLHSCLPGKNSSNNLVLTTSKQHCILSCIPIRIGL